MEEGAGQVYTTSILTHLCSSPNPLGDIGGSLLGSKWQFFSNCPVPPGMHALGNVQAFLMSLRLHTITWHCKQPRKLYVVRFPGEGLPLVC